MKGLIIVLWITSILCLVCFLGLIIPWTWISAILSFTDLDIAGYQGVEKYAARISCAGFGMIGIFFLILARNPSYYGTMISFGGYGLLVVSAFCLAWGIYYSFTWWNWLGDVLCCGILGGLILLFKSKSGQFTPG